MKEEAFLADNPGIAPDIVSSTDAYARRFSGSVGSWMLSVQSKAIDTMLARHDGTILDVGGGHAQVTPRLMLAGRDITALLGAPEATGRLDRLTKGRARYRIGSTQELALPERSYDLAIAMRMMAHVADWEVFLSSLCRVARKAVIIDFPISTGIHHLVPMLFGMKKAIEKDTRTYRSFTHAEIAEAFRRNGFVPESHVGQFVIPMAMHRAMNMAPISRAAEAILSPLASRQGNPVIMCARRVRD